MQQHFYALRKAFAASFVLLFVFTTSILRGQTQYIGANNGDWATATNWNNGSPSATNPPTIGGGAIVCINGALTLDFPINNFGTIVNKGTATLTSNLIGGTLDNQASFTVATGAQANINNGFTNSGTFTNRGAVNVNTIAASNAALGTINNESSWDQLSAFTNNGIVDCKAGIFSSPTTITNNKTLEVRSGANYKVDFGGAFVNALGSVINNAGAFSNLGSFTNNTTVNNTGTFINNSTHDCFGTFNNESGAQLNSTATVNFTGRLNNKLGATVTSGFRFNVNAGGYVSNVGTFNNNNMIDVKLGGTLSNETTGVVNLGFGSAIVNAGYIATVVGSKITGNGAITNNKKLDNYGLIESNNGAAISNTDTLCNFGTIRNVNTVSNTKYWKNAGTLENNSGGVLTNIGNFENFKGGLVSNNYEIYNKPAATMTNNGTFANAVRLFNEGLFINNAYFVTTGDFYNRAGATFTNTEVVEIKEGSIVNEGTMNNQKLFFNNSCSVLSNKSTINNTGRLESWGIVFQRGTVTGTAIVSNAGFVQTGATSAAPSICRDTVKTGVDPIGEAKVYGQNPLLPTLGIDACNAFQYSVDNQTRAVYPCAKVGQTFPVPFRLLTRTGDSLTCTLKISVFDNVPPTISGCPNDVTIITGQSSAIYTWTTPTAVDNCAGVPVIASTKASGSAFPVGLTEVIITATDASSVQSECRFKVNVQKIVATGTCLPTDNTPPVFTNCPTNQVLTTQNGGVAAVWNTPSVSDPCLPIFLFTSANSGQIFPVGTTTVTYTASDVKTNTATCSFTITVSGSSNPCATDNIAPVITNCPNNFFTTLNPAINGGVGVWATPSASDNCSGATLTSNFQTGTIFPAGNTVVTYTAKDGLNNTSTCSFTVNVAATNPCAGDVTPPSITCPANVVANTTTNFATATWTVPTATDNCGTPSVNATHTPGQNFGVGVTTVTYAASDANGNRKTCSFTVTINNPCFSDTTAPVISNCPANQTVLGASGSATATWTAPTATDNCTLAGVTSNYQSGTAFPVGTTAVTYTATDKAGNKSNCTFNITVQIGTVTTCVGNIVLNQSFEQGLTKWLNINAIPTVSSDAKSGASALEICTDNAGATSQFYPVTTGGTYTLKVFAKIKGGTPSATIGLNFYNATNVLLATGNATATVNTATYTEYTLTANVPATAANLKVVANKGTGAGCLVIDDVCLTNPCTNDVTPPTLTACPANIVQNLTGTATSIAVTWTAPTATDNCGTPSVISTFPSGATFSLGTTTVLYTATDPKGLTATCSFTVTVNNPCATDAVAPSFGTTCSANKTGASTNGLCVAVNFTAPTATDNCGTPSVSGTHANNFCFPIGVTTVTYTAADSKNNKATCTFTVTITGTAATDCATTTPTGGITREFFQLTSTTFVSPVVVPTTVPTTTTVLTSFVAPQNIADNYIQRIRGFLRPTVSGNYTFYVTGDDNSDLYIGTTTNAASKTRIAYINGWTLNDELYKYPSQKSVAVALVAGQNYYIEAVEQEGGGGDNLAVYWQTPTAPTAAPLIIPGANLVPFCTVDPCIAALSVGGTVAPASQTIALSAAGVVPTRHTLSGYVGTIVGWEYQTPNSTVWNNWGGGGSASAPNNCCFSTAGTWKVRAIIKNGLCSEKVSSEGLIVVTATQTPVSCADNLIANFSFESDLADFNNWGNTAISTTEARSGGKAAQIGLPSGGFGFNFHVKQGTAVSFISWNKTEGTVTWAGLGITFYDAAWVKIPTVEVVGAISSTNYGQVSLSAVAPVGAVNATVWAWKEGQTGYMITDDWCLTTTPPAGFVPDPNKCYKIVNKVSGKVIDISGASTLNGAVVQQWDYVDGQNQKFKFVDAGEGFYSIRAVHSGLPLDIENDAITERAYSLQRTLDGTGSQLFALPNVGGGYINLVNRTSGKALKTDASPGVNGTRLIQLTINATYEHQKWQIVEVPCTTAPCTVAGSVQFERWNNYVNTTWTLPVLIPAGNPTISQTQGNTQGAWNVADNYMTRVRGYIKPQTTGVYSFNVTGDDNTELYVSPNSSASGMVRVASIQGWTSEYEYNKYASQTSANITLTAGQLYYFEFRQVESGGGDGWNIFWKTPTNATWQIIQSQFLARPCTNGVYAATSANVFTFMAKADGNQAKLQWVSNGGVQNDYYEVERVNANGEFEKLGTVNAYTGKSEPESFSFTDENPLDGENTYRIKTVENNGTIKFSGNETVNFAKNTEGVRLFPNPANDYVDIDLKKYNGLHVTISVYNQFGKLIQSAQIEKASNALFHLELGDVATGAYLIRVQPQGKREVTKKLQIAK